MFSIPTLIRLPLPPPLLNVSHFHKTTSSKSLHSPAHMLMLICCINKISSTIIIRIITAILTIISRSRATTVRWTRPRYINMTWIRLPDLPLSTRRWIRRGTRTATAPTLRSTLNSNSTTFGRDLQAFPRKLHRKFRKELRAFKIRRRSTSRVTCTIIRVSTCITIIITSLCRKRRRGRSTRLRTGIIRRLLARIRCRCRQIHQCRVTGNNRRRLNSSRYFISNTSWSRNSCSSSWSFSNRTRFNFRRNCRRRSGNANIGSGWTCSTKNRRKESLIWCTRTFWKIHRMLWRNFSFLGKVCRGKWSENIWEIFSSRSTWLCWSISQRRWTSRDWQWMWLWGSSRDTFGCQGRRRRLRGWWKFIHIVMVSAILRW